MIRHYIYYIIRSILYLVALSSPAILSLIFPTLNTTADPADQLPPEHRCDGLACPECPAPPGYIWCSTAAPIMTQLELCEAAYRFRDFCFDADQTAVEEEPVVEESPAPPDTASVAKREYFDVGGRRIDWPPSVHGVFLEVLRDSLGRKLRVIKHIHRPICAANPPP